MATTFSEKLKQAMNSKRINQSTLARRVGVTPTAVWNWENNGVIPRRKALLKLERVLGVDLSDFSSDGAEEEELEDVSIAEEIDRLAELVAEANGVSVDRVSVEVTIS